LLQRLEVEGYVWQAGGHRRRYHLTTRLVALGLTVAAAELRLSDR
jgi:DNA-binding IclR family transcriptional regulator